MALDMTTADAALKEDLKPGVKSTINNKCKLLKQIEVNTEDIQGQYARLAIHIGRSGGVGARAEGGTLPDHGNQRYAEQQVLWYTDYGRSKFTGKVMRASRSDKGAFIRASKSEMKGLVEDCRRQVNRASWGTSDGKIATCGVTAAANVIVLASTTTDRQMRQLYKNLKVDIGTVANPTSRAAARKITAVSRANKTITVDGTVITTAATDFVFVAGNGGAIGGVGQKEITGAQTIVATSGTLFNIDPTVDPEWVATVDHNSGVDRPFTERLVTKNINTVQIECGADVDILFSSEGVFGAAEVHLATKRRTNEPVELKGGHKGIAFSTGDTDAALTWDRDTPEDSLFGFTLSELTYFTASDWEWMDEDGSVLNRIANEDAYEATLFKDHEFATGNRPAHMWIKDIQEAA